MTDVTLEGNCFEVLGEEVLPVALEFEEHDAIAELGMAGYNAPSHADRRLIKPKGGVNVASYDERHHELYVATAATQVGCLKPKGNITAFLANLDGDLDGITTINAPVRMSEGGGIVRLFIRKNHGTTHTGIEGPLLMMIIGKGAAAL